MNVTRDVILDLLPLCHAGEASDDTHKLVAAFAAEDAEIARLLATPPARALPETPLLIDKETEMQTLERTKTYMKWQTVLLGGASFLTFFAVFVLLALGTFLTLFRVEQESRTLLLLAATGGLLAVLLAAAAWTGYFVFRHHYRMGSPAGPAQTR